MGAVLLCSLPAAAEAARSALLDRIALAAMQGDGELMFTGSDDEARNVFAVRFSREDRADQFARSLGDSVNSGIIVRLVQQAAFGPQGVAPALFP
jgi:hypothetical protein